MSRKNPYRADPRTGESVTREYVERFLERAFDTPDGGPPILGRLYGPSDSLNQLLENIYLSKNPDSAKQYVGKASRQHGRRNPQEEIWCLKLDIASACKKLPTQERRILGQRYVRGYDDKTIGDQEGISHLAVRCIALNAIFQIAQILDRET